MKRVWREIKSAFVLLVALWAIGLICFIHYTASLTAPSRGLHTDAIVVLTGGAGRTSYGLDLLEDGASGQLFISGVGPKVTTADLVALWKQRGAKAPCCITLGRAARNTAENAVETRDWASAQHVRSVRLVTAAYHMPRAWLHFHHLMPDVEILTCPAPLVPGSFEERHLEGLTFIEYNKTLVTWVMTYILPPGFLHA